jgi:DNA-directed RNA polymerase specialized sigma24 family protein
MNKQRKQVTDADRIAKAHAADDAIAARKAERKKADALTAAARATVAYTAARHERDGAIVAACLAGASYREVAALTNVSHETVRTMVAEALAIRGEVVA